MTKDRLAQIRERQQRCGVQVVKKHITKQSTSGKHAVSVKLGSVFLCAMKLVHGKLF